VYNAQKEHITAQKIAAEISKLDMTPTTPTPAPGPATEKPTEKDIIVDFSNIHFGRGKDNPMKDVKFYSKRQPNGDFLRNLDKSAFDRRALGCYIASAETGSHVQPPQCGEVLLRVYARNNRFVVHYTMLCTQVILIVD
jgi:hypothetical protein